MNINIKQPIDTYPANATPGEFPLTLAACIKFEKANDKTSLIQFEIGDALIAECGPVTAKGVRTGRSSTAIEAAHEYLASKGYKYALDSLKHLRLTSSRFEAPNRLRSLSWTAHFEARSPDVLRKAIEAYPDETITVAMIREFRTRPQFVAEHAVSKRIARASEATKPGPATFRSFADLARGDEIAALFLSCGHARTMIQRLAKDRGGKDIWSLILQSRDAGFLTHGTNPSLPTIKLLFPDAPLSWTKNYLLTEAKDRAYIRDELMPAMIANKEALIATPERIEIILREHFAKVGHQKKLAAIEVKAEVAKAVMNPHEKEVFLFGKRFWPIVEKTNSDYDFEQLTAAWFTVNDMWGLGKSGGQSAGACAHAVRFAVGRLERYATGQEATPVRNNFRRVFHVMRSIADALEKPEGDKFDPPMKPR